jgi:hypothetical protein
MSYKSLATMITEGKTIKAVCPRCRGSVTLPTEVMLIDRASMVRYTPDGQCHRCGVTWSWHGEKNPVGGTAIWPKDKGRVNLWFCDRELNAPAPTIVE